jgi:hypothetical protein
MKRHCRPTGRAGLPGLLAAAAMLATACGTGVTTASSVSPPVPPGTPGSASEATSDATTRGAPPSARFPDTTAVVQLVGYDDALHMVEFRLAVAVTGKDATAHRRTKYYNPDPNDPATHRLPVSDDASIDIPDYGCAAQACTLDQLIDSIKQYQPCGELHVNADDRIDRVREDVAPMNRTAPSPRPVGG